MKRLTNCVLAAAASTLCACSEAAPVEETADQHRSITIPAAPGGSGAWAVTIRAEQLVRAFYTALAEGRVHHARQMVFGSEDPKRHAKLTQELESFAGMLLSKKLEVRVCESQESGKCALVVVSMKIRQGEKTETRLREEFVVVHKGEWFVVPEAMRSEAAIRPLMEKHGKPMFEDFRRRLPELRKKYQ